MVKNLKHYKINRSKSLINQHVSVKSFPDAKIRSMKYDNQLMLEEIQPDRILSFISQKSQRNCVRIHRTSGYMPKIKNIYFCICLLLLLSLLEMTLT